MVVAFIGEKVDERSDKERGREKERGCNDPRRLMMSRRTKNAEKLRLQVVGAFLHLRVDEQCYSTSAKHLIGLQ